MDPNDARMMPEPDARHEFLFDDQPWIRVGQTEDWAFAFEEIWLVGYLENAGLRLSAGTEAVVLSWTAKPTKDVTYLVDGRLTTAFEPGRAWDRAGNEPDRFLAEMRQVGLDTERGDPGERSACVQAKRARFLDARRRGVPIEVFDPFVAALNMLTLALDIRLPEDVVRGPLLTVARRSG